MFDFARHHTYNDWVMRAPLLALVQVVVLLFVLPNPEQCYNLEGSEIPKKHTATNAPWNNGGWCSLEGAVMILRGYYDIVCPAQQSSWSSVPVHAPREITHSTIVYSTITAFS